MKQIITGALGLVAIVVIIILLSSIRVINAGEVGIKTRMGKVVGTEITEGVVLKLPFVEKITKISVRVHKFEVAGSSASRDLQDVTIDVAVNYNVQNTEAVRLFRNVGTKYEETILAPAIQEAIKAVSASYTAEELITKRREVSIKMQEELTEKVERYGLSIDNFNIMNFNFSAAFNQAIEDKQVAEQKVATARNNMERARIEADQKIMEAEATAKSNQLMEQSLTKAILEQRAIEKWDGKLPQYIGSGSVPFINLK